MKNIILAISAVGLLSSAQAIVLTSINFTGGSTLSQVNNYVNPTAFGTSVGSIVSDAFQVTGTNVFGTYADNLADSDYHVIGLTVSGLTGSQTLSLTNITADAFGDFPDGDAYAIGAVINSTFTSVNDGLFDEYQIANGGAANSFDFDIDTDLSSITGLTNGDTVTIGFFYESTSATNTSANPGRLYNLDNIVVNGEIVPEPSSSALIGLGGLVILSRRRR